MSRKRKDEYQDYASWLQDTVKELDGTSRDALIAMERIGAVRMQATLGTFVNVYGIEVRIENRDLACMLASAIQANILGWLAHGERREHDAARHFDHYYRATRRIYSSAFTDEEQALAYRVLD